MHLSGKSETQPGVKNGIFNSSVIPGKTGKPSWLENETHLLQGHFNLRRSSSIFRGKIRTISECGTEKFLRVRYTKITLLIEKYFHFVGAVINLKCKILFALVRKQLLGNRPNQ